MSYFYKRLEAHLKALGDDWSFYKLQFASRISSGTFSQWKQGKRRPSDNDLKKLAATEGLKLSEQKLRAWRAIDEYGADTLREALQDLGWEIAPESKS